MDPAIRENVLERLDAYQVKIRICQGESDDALENVKISEFTVEDLADAPAGNIILVDLALDRDGIPRVSAKEKATGREQRITIDRARHATTRRSSRRRVSISIACSVTSCSISTPEAPCLPAS